jgi:hypothetical protein
MAEYELSKKQKKIAYFGGHIPNKNEAEALRKIMASTGLSEKEVRADANYKKALSEASKRGNNPKRSDTEKAYQTLIKKACKRTGLVPEHPETLKVLDEILKNEKDRYFSRSFILSKLGGLDAKQVVEKYRRK